MTKLDDLVRDFISGALDYKMRPGDMEKILEHFGYTTRDKGVHRKYKSHGHRNIHIHIQHGSGESTVSYYSVQEARKVLDNEGLL
jgi:predicted RNA binding protein YcfA (HicA-like mRNA interferase family)